MQLVLEKYQIENLRKIYKRTNGKERQAAQATLLSAEGWSQFKIAKTLNLEVQIVVFYLQEYLKSEKTNTRKRLVEYKLTTNQKAEFVAHIESNPSLSMSKMIEYIKQHYGEVWKAPALQAFLKENNFSYRSKRVLYREVINKFQQTKFIYHSICGWFRNQAEI